MAVKVAVPPYLPLAVATARADAIGGPASKAPTSQWLPLGRIAPRWSSLLTLAAPTSAQTVSLPALRAGLPSARAMVGVGPPLSARPAGLSVIPAATTWLLFAPLAKQVASSARLFPLLV